MVSTRLPLFASLPVKCKQTNWTFTSLAFMTVTEKHPRNDLQGLALTLIHCVSSLPWTSCWKSEESPSRNWENTLQVKKETSLEELLEGVPEGLATYSRKVFGLAKDDPINYEELVDCFSEDRTSLRTE